MVSGGSETDLVLLGLGDRGPGDLLLLVISGGWCDGVHTIPRYTILHYTTSHYTTLYCTSLHSTTLHYTPLHYTTLHYTTLHYRSAPSPDSQEVVGRISRQSGEGAPPGGRVPHLVGCPGGGPPPPPSIISQPPPPFPQLLPPVCLLSLLFCYQILQVLLV